MVVCEKEAPNISIKLLKQYRGLVESACRRMISGGVRLSGTHWCRHRSACRGGGERDSPADQSCVVSGESSCRAHGDGLKAAGAVRWETC